MSCSTPTSNTGTAITVIGIKDSETYGSSIACYYQAAGETDLAREVDFIWGAASQFGVPAKVALAHRIIEGAPSGANAFQLDPSNLQSFTQWVNTKKPSTQGPVKVPQTPVVSPFLKGVDICRSISYSEPLSAKLRTR